MALDEMRLNPSEEIVAVLSPPPGASQSKEEVTPKRASDALPKQGMFDTGEPPKVKDHSGNGLDGTMQASPAQLRAIDGADCLARDTKTAQALDLGGAWENRLKKVCLLCGALIPADDWQHELSIECARKRNRRHLPELPRMRHFTGDEE